MSEKILPVKKIPHFSSLVIGLRGETIDVHYTKPMSQPSASSILEKYRIPWRHEAKPSFIDGVARSFDFLGISKPRTKSSSLRIHRNFRMRKAFNLLGDLANNQEGGR